MFSLLRYIGSILYVQLLLTACFPKYDWRDVDGGEAPYTVLMPHEPSRLNREIQIGQRKVTMQMTAVQIDEVKFAVGTVKLPNATEAQKAVGDIKTMLVNNIAGKISQEKTTVSNAGGKLAINDEFTAVNSTSSIRMSGRIVASDVWAFEVLVVGPERAINQDAVDTFLTSFKP